MATPSRLGSLGSLSTVPRGSGGETDAQKEFLAAVERYRTTQGRPFPTWSEVLEIAEGLGYHKASSVPAGARFVVVEDHEATREALQTELVREGFEVVAVGTVAAALAALESAPDFMILELTLPDGDGETVLQAIRAKQLPTRVAVSSGVEDDDRWDRVRRLRPHALLRKPVRIEDVLSACGWTASRKSRM